MRRRAASLAGAKANNAEWPYTTLSTHAQVLLVRSWFIEKGHATSHSFLVVQVGAGDLREVPDLHQNTHVRVGWGEGGNEGGTYAFGR